MHSALVFALTLLLRPGRSRAVDGDIYLLPEGTGPFRTSLQHSELVDKSRLDPWNSSHVRRLMISRFEPVAPSKCDLILVPYVPLKVAKAEDEILAAFDYPKGLWEKVRLQVCNEHQ